MAHHGRRKVYLTPRNRQRGGMGPATASIGANLAARALSSTASIALPILLWELAAKPGFRYAKKRASKSTKNTVASSTGLQKCKPL